jgi:hypothetical protein
MVGGRNDVVIEPNILYQPAPKPGRRPAPEWKGLPPAGVPTREPPPQSPQHGLGELTRRLEAELQGSAPLQSRLRRSTVTSAPFAAQSVGKPLANDAC